MEEPRFYTIKQVADMLGVHRTTIYDWMNAGKLVYVQVGERRRIPKAALDAFIKAGEPARTDPPPNDSGGIHRRVVLAAA